MIGADLGAVRLLTDPARLNTAHDVRARPCPVPRVAGVYAWYFAQVPPGVPTDGCVTVAGLPLLYVGISPKAPSAKGVSASRQTIRTRIRYHFRGNAAGSTLRLTLGCLLATELGIALRRVGSGSRLTFGPEGERLITDWMTEHARVVWAPTPDPWVTEEHLIRELVLPLNLDQNRRSSFYEVLSAARAAQRRAARELPIATT